MKTLNTTLILTYALLIALLLLQRCERQRNSTPSPPAGQEEAQPLPADSSDVRRAREAGGSGALKITLLWDWFADVDLHVIQPNGTEICYRHTQDDSTGGQLDRDNTIGGPNSAENIFFATPPSGNYKVWLRLYKEKGDSRGPCTLIILQDGHEPVRYEVELSPLHRERSVCTVSVGGR